MKSQTRRGHNALKIQTRFGSASRAKQSPSRIGRLLVGADGLVAHVERLIFEWLGELGVHRRGRKPERLSIFIGVGEPDGAHTSQVHGRQAHRAWLPARIDDAPVQPRAAQHLGGLADRGEFGVGRRISRRTDLIHPRGDHLAVLHDQRAEGTSVVVAYIGERQVDRLSQEVLLSRYRRLLTLRPRYLIQHLPRQGHS